MKRFNVLVTAGSGSVSLVHAFRSALRTTGNMGSVLVADANPLSPAVHVADRFFRVPHAGTTGYVEELLAVCEAEGVRLAVPTVDDELSIFGEAREAFDAIGVAIPCSPDTTWFLCSDRYSTCARLMEAGVPAARSYLPAQLEDGLELPLLVKPRTRSGTVGVFQAHSYEQLDFFLHYVETPIVQEYLGGPEYTLDVLCDFDGRPLSIVPRECVEIGTGVRCCRTVSDKGLIALAEAVCAAIPFAGPVSVRCRMRHDQPVVFGITPLFSDGISLAIQAGADFAEMLIRLAMGRKVAPRIGEFRADLWMTSFQSAFFLDGEALPDPQDAIATRRASLNTSSSCATT